MKILSTGASGFIGRHILAALTAHGHDVVCPVRGVAVKTDIGRASFVPAQFARMTRPDDWLPWLHGVDCVINAAGVFSANTQELEAVHTHAPRALFEAARGTRVIQISALGASIQAETAFLRTKAAADEALRRRAGSAFIVQPSLVYGPGGASAAWFERLALMPVLLLPSGGRQLMQPVHIDDLVAGIVSLIDTPVDEPVTIAFCGPTRLSIRDYLQVLHDGLGSVGRQYVIPVPMALCKAVAPIGERGSGGLLSRDSLTMLERGNVADPQPFARLLGRPARAPDQFIGEHDSRARHSHAVLGLTLPTMRLCIAFVWLWTAIVSFGLYPAEQSLAMLRDVGVSAALAPMALYGAATLDLLLGVLTLALRGPGRRWLWLAQILLILGYTLIITVRLPEQWLHPFGPMSKNLPMLAALMLLWFYDARKR
jgi:uncharacterized protein YbjT (DUF2867 family)